MKFLPAILLLALPFTMMAQTNAVYEEAVAAYKKGDYDQAKSLFQSVLAEKPGDKASANYLRAIALRQKGLAGGTLEASLRQIVIPRLDLKDTNFRDAIAYVGQQVKAVSGGKQTLNVVWLIPTDANVPVTLNLQEVPATEALKYIVDLAGFSVGYDDQALKIMPLGEKAPQ